VPEVTADDHTLGPAGAPVTVLEYGDYECPFCRGAYRDVHRMLDLYPGSILFAFRNFPIQQLHPHAEQAAEAAEAAAAQGKFWEMYELLLRPSSSLDLDSLMSHARELGLEKVMFEAADPEVFGWYVKNYGPEVNLFVDHSQIVQLECLRRGIWGTKSLWGRVVTYPGE